MSAARNLDDIAKNESALGVNDAVAYLKTIGMIRISPKTLRNRLCLGTGPRHAKISGSLVFRKVDLDAWVKCETTKFEAYQR
jgi:hypothetical protein